MINVGRLGREIRRVRTECGWSQRYLASKAEVSVGCISMLENGNRNISTPLLGRIGDAFGIPASFLTILAEEARSDDMLLEIVQATVRAGIQELCPKPRRHSTQCH